MCRKATCLIATCCAVTLLPAFVRAEEAPAAKPAAGAVVWTTADELLPAWGFYPTSQDYGGTKPLGRVMGWTAGSNSRVTWVADLPAAAAWDVWVRRYVGYGTIRVEVDEKPVTGGRAHPGGARYAWDHQGKVSVGKGSHHVDVQAVGGMLDAVLFSSDPAFSPETGKLPAPVKGAVLRANRTYRDDSPLGDKAVVRGYVVAQIDPDEELLHDWVPAPSQIRESVRLWGAADQYVTGTFAVRALEPIEELHATLGELVGPEKTGTTRIGPEQIDLRVVQVRARSTHLFDAVKKMLVPEMLLRDDRTGMPPKGKQGGFGGGTCVTQITAHESRQFWLTVHVFPGTPPGGYYGQIVLEVPGAPQRRIAVPVELELLPIDLRPSEGYYSIYYPAQPIDPKQSNYVPPERYLAELKDQARHGLNAATLYGGYGTLHFAREAGLLKAPCVMNYPDGDAPKQVAEAKKLGFEDLYYYGVDEPWQPKQIEACRKEAERRVAAGLHMLTAISNVGGEKALRDLVDRPVLCTYVFFGPDNADVMYVRGKGFRPISYWMTSTTWPLYCRALTGLYNKRCGYLGSAPWAYSDYVDNRVYGADEPFHRVSYPDEFGQPISTLIWEGHRAGIDDVRYLEALDRAIAACQQRASGPGAAGRFAAAVLRGREVRRRCYETVGGRYIEYLCNLQPRTLDLARRDIADATAALQQELHQSKGGLKNR